MMARIDSLTEKDPLRTTVHSRVDATFHAFTQDGVQYLQIDTYGSSDRDGAGKVTQSVQFSGEGLALLRQILDKLA
ncbi:hypothetical protein [Pseudotabrizicola sp. 4114]|uniref:hypothetical protein n=1 Tax=Pseudotabrizicola sp. 4114 TaxID=2817731 RepID=UPI0028651BDE|nr:hypothetical protein [Pseudorhodobacter sp. 4114]